MQMKSILKVNILLVLISISLSLSAQKSIDSYLNKRWREVSSRMPDEWYGSADSKMAADSILKYQTTAGGWSKNTDFHSGGMKQDEWKRIKESGVGATFDNGATTTEMMFLAKMYVKTNDDRYKAAFLRGLNYIFEAQYTNGGWPQFYPVRKGFTSYSGHITYNDGAMVNVMNLLNDIAKQRQSFASLNIGKELIKKARESYEKGVDCILKTQITQNGKLTVWCAQHDEITLAPANARAYELASFSGGESVGIIELLMKIENPSKDIVNAINASVQWFQDHKLQGIRMQEFINAEGEKDRKVVDEKSAPDIWARFYDLETGKPYFCDRDGVKRVTFAEMGYNRRNGYSWYTYAPQKMMDEYAKWSKLWR